MGTHPIFESDFDCLTECQNQLLTGSRMNYFESVVYQMLMQPSFLSQLRKKPNQKKDVSKILSKPKHWKLMKNSLMSYGIEYMGNKLRNPRLRKKQNHQARRELKK